MSVRNMPIPSERVRALHAMMTLEEKLAQIVGFWVDKGDEMVAPMSGELGNAESYDEAVRHGIGHLTRVYGTRPVDPIARAQWLWAEQRRLKTETRLGIPALVHEECLTGLAAWQAAIFPTPLAWGASFDDRLVHEMALLIGGSMRELGIHQGLAPVLDVIRDPRWGRVDECISEDPYLVATIGTAYVRGLQEAGVHATLKHFVGYSASQAGRNHAPAHLGEREVRDVLLLPFEMAVRDGGARSVMNSYAEIDGVPLAAHPGYLTDILRDEWGFEGVVVADYFAVSFLHSMHGIAADSGEAARLALTAGIDIELPTGDAFLKPLAEKIKAGDCNEELVDQSVLRLLAQKEELGLLDESFDVPPEMVALDSGKHRLLARTLAEESIILLTNNGVLPIGADSGGIPSLPVPRRIAVIGPNADSSEALLGCYSFVNHVLAHHPGVEAGVELPTVLEALRAEFPGATVTHEPGCQVEGEDASGIDSAVAAARGADLAVVVVGDRAGLFGRGTVGEGNDAQSLGLPGLQRELVESVTRTGTPTVLIVLSGRPYALGWAADGPHSPDALIQSFFPGEEGGNAIAAVLSGRVAPSGRLPVSMPRAGGAQPYSYLHPRLGGPSEITSADSTPVFPFGHGLTYTSFERSGLTNPAVASTNGCFRVSVRVRNSGDRAGTDIVQLYAHDVYASVTRPVAQLLGYARIELEAGAQSLVHFDVPTARVAFSDYNGVRIVEPGLIQLWVGSSCNSRETESTILLTGSNHVVTGTDLRIVGVEEDAPAR